MEALLGPIGARPYLEARTRPAADGQRSLLDGPDAEDAASVTYASLTAAVTGKDRAAILDGIASGEVDLVVGTHALVQEAVAFADLSLAVIDEQHRFGVHQRMALKGKGGAPDVLIMAATPIPRTLALTYYGDLDVVVLDEMPKGRPADRDARRADKAERSAAYRLVREEVRPAARRSWSAPRSTRATGRRSAPRGRGRAARDEGLPGPVRRAAPRPHAPGREGTLMEEFRSGRHHLLISTTVIEVGVDVPNATVMLVENAERFGLAQLHQLRGRIGRSTHPSTCILFDGSEE